MSKLPNNFNPSPFDEPNESNEEKYTKKAMEGFISFIEQILGITPMIMPIPQKINSLPLQVIHRHYSDDANHLDVFQGHLKRENKEIILGYLFTWLEERNLFSEGNKPTQEVFISTVWKVRFEQFFTK